MPHRRYMGKCQHVWRRGTTEQSLPEMISEVCISCRLSKQTNPGLQSATQRSRFWSVRGADCAFVCKRLNENENSCNLLAITIANYLYLWMQPFLRSKIFFARDQALSFAAVDRCSAGLCAHPGALSDCSYSELEPDRSKPDHTKPGPGSTE